MIIRLLKIRLFELLRIHRLNSKIAVLLALSVIVIFYHITSVFRTELMDSMEFYKDFREEISDPRQTCQIPVFHPFSEDVLGYFQNPKPIVSRNSVLTCIDEKGYLRYNYTAFNEAGYAINSLKCYYQEIHKMIGDDDEVTYGEEIPMTGRDKPKSDFIYVFCKRYSWLPVVYSMYHAFAQKKSHVRTFYDDKEVGVAVIGIDSVSRLNFMRQLPYSYRYITKGMNGIVLRGFNKVGENTFPNIVAILTGNPPVKRPKSTFDDWPFIWKFLNEDKVATFYGEDCPSIMTFAWWGEGFYADPTTHYFRPYWVAAESSSLAKLSSSLCLGEIPKHKIYLDYLKSFFYSYSQSPIFMFSLENEVSHDYLNTVGVIDSDLKQLLSSGYQENLFNRTILFVLSDHGQRLDDFRITKQGKAEDRMPMVSVVLPKWYTELYPDILSNLEANSGRLTSSYDLYSTFVDIFSRNKMKGGGKTGLKFPKPMKGMSLFERVPLNRTCEDAGIPEIYCICVEGSKKLKNNDEMTVESLAIIENYINNEVLKAGSRTWSEIIKNYSSLENDGENLNDVDFSSIQKCARLTFQTEFADLVVGEDGRRLLQLTFKTYPNGGVFEGKVLWPKGSQLIGGRIYGDIIRINRYGKQSNCLPKTIMILLPLIRSVCFCV